MEGTRSERQSWPMASKASLHLGVVSLGAASSVSAVWEVSCSQAIGAGLGTAEREGIVSYLEVSCSAARLQRS